MTLTRRRFLAISAAACVPGAVSADTVWKGHALGAPASITLMSNQAAARPALLSALDAIRRVEKAFSLFRADSELQVLNRSGRLDMSPTFAALFAEAGRMHAATDGLFDPSVGAAWQAFMGGTPGPVGWQNVRTGGSAVEMLPGMALTFNGIAQGFATDRVAAALQAHGFRDVVVDIGEIWVGDREAVIGIAGPDRMLARLSLRNSAVATSSPAALQVAGNDHILHPKGGRPHWDTVSVEAANATTADAVSTALTLSEGTDLARRLVRDKVIRRARLFGKDGRTIAV